MGNLKLVAVRYSLYDGLKHSLAEALLEFGVGFEVLFESPALEVLHTEEMALLLTDRL